MITLKQYLGAKEILDEYHQALGRGEDPDFPQDAQDIVDEWNAKELTSKAIDRAKGKH